MKKYSKYIYIAAMTMAVGLSSCDSYLDKLPDNRMELDNADDAKGLLLSAYPDRHPAYLLEMYSDNTDYNKNPSWSEADYFQGEAYKWQDITSIGNDESPQALWNSCYRAVASANQALEFLESLSEDEQEEYKEIIAEAHLCRAYGMFSLSNVFCQAYDKATAAKELGLPYPLKPETKIGVKYERGTLEELYKTIDLDIQKGLAGVGNNYEHPKYHFTKTAANAFAARFYLYYQQYDKAIKYATAALGSNSSNNLRDWKAFYKLSANGQIAPNAYVDSDNKANFLLQATYSEWGAIAGPYRYGDKYAHGRLIAEKEDLQCSAPWGSNSSMGYNVWHNNSLAKYFINKVPYSFEMTDIQAQIGNPHSTLPVFNADETLLVRAEAKALLGDYEGSVEDLNTELYAYSAGRYSVTLDKIKTFYQNLAYYTPEKPTSRKAFHTSFTIEPETQEPLLQAILLLRRVLTIGEGLRMQDVKRYGMVIYRRTVSESAEVLDVTDSLTVNDPRRAIQLPQDVITAGLEGNPRIK